MRDRQDLVLKCYLVYSSLQTAVRFVTTILVSIHKYYTYKHSTITPLTKVPGWENTVRSRCSHSDAYVDQEYVGSLVLTLIAHQCLCPYHDLLRMVVFRCPSLVFIYTTLESMSFQARGVPTLVPIQGIARIQLPQTGDGCNSPAFSLHDCYSKRLSDKQGLLGSSGMMKTSGTE